MMSKIVLDQFLEFFDPNGLEFFLMCFKILLKGWEWNDVTSKIDITKKSHLHFLTSHKFSNVNAQLYTERKY